MSVPGGAETGEQSSPNRDAEVGEERRQGPGVQLWADGSTYEGDFENGFKHGRGKFTWSNKEYYKGSFYKDYRHGDGLFCWPTGHKFIGKFYLNTKEGYGQHLFPDGASFQGLYHADQRFGPGVVTYSDGRQDVGLWLGHRLLRLCTAVEEAFTLENFPEYAPYMEAAATTDSLTQPPDLSGCLQTNARTHLEAHTDRDLLSDEKFIYPADMESYSTDGNHLPLPPGRRKELDQHFYGEQWEPGADLHQGYERDPLSNLPLQARMQAHIYNHRRQAENVGWNVEAVLSLDRDGFGPKGPLEVDSERFICHASRGEVQAVRQILKSGLVHPDVADSQGDTALIAATVHCHNDLIQLLLDMGADIDKLNHEGMSALAVCHVLYYPFCSLDTTLAKPPAKTQALLSLSACGNSPQISQVDSNTDTSEPHNRPQTSHTSLSDQSLITDQAAQEQMENKSHHGGKTCSDGDLAALECRAAPEETEEGGELQVSEESRHKDNEGGSERKERSVVEEHDRAWESENCVKRFVESRNGAVELGDCESVRHREERRSVHRSIQVLDGHIALGSVQWRERRVNAAAVVEQDKDEDKDLTIKQSFDSACSLSSYSIHVTEEAMQRSAEALSRIGLLQYSGTQETVRKMAAMKTEHRGYLSTLELLLDRGADPNVSKVPMPVLFLAIMAADTEAVKRLLLCGAHTDIPLPPERKGLYPLHVAAALPGSAGTMITELLLHAVTDPDLHACDHDEIYEPDRASMKCQKPPIVKQGGRTALHVACQRDKGYQDASTVVALLLSHSARTDLLWSGHSPLSLAIASGNELAVEELLKGGADPNIPLGRGVGSALCTVTNFSYPLDGKRPNLLDMLVKAGADALMPVMVGDFMGTAVDYAHSSFYQDLRIANTPFHALNVQERETFIARRQLLSTMGDLLRQTVIKREAEALERERQLILDGGTDPSRLHITGKHKKSSFKFCYQCGLSASMKLTACTRCNKVFFCSTDCKLKAWDERHKEECVRVSASANGIKKKCTTDPETAETAEAAETDVILKENYSLN